MKRSTTLERSERWAGMTLRVGVWVSSLMMLSGLIMAFITGTVSVPAKNPTLSELVSFLMSDELLHVSARSSLALMFTGLVLLMLTPFFRVIATTLAFASTKDRRYVAISILVLIMLIGQLIYSLS